MLYIFSVFNSPDGSVGVFAVFVGVKEPKRKRGKKTLDLYYSFSSFSFLKSKV